MTFDSTVYCGTCWFCRRGEINLCDQRRVLGVSCDEYRRHGAFAEYVAVPQRILVRLPDGVSFHQAAMIEPLSIAFHAVRRTPLSLGDTAVVVGAGMIGLLVVQALRAAGCGQIIAVDIDRQRLDMARQLGATEGLLSGAVDVPAEVFRKTDGRGADVAIEVVGISSAAADRHCIGSQRRPRYAGRQPGCLHGLPAASGRHARIDAPRVVRFPRRISGLPRHDRAGSGRRRFADQRGRPVG